MADKIWILTGTDDGGIPWAKPFTTKELAIAFILREENEIAEEDGDDYLTESDLDLTSYFIAEAKDTYSGTNYLLTEEELDQ